MELFLLDDYSAAAKAWTAELASSSASSSAAERAVVLRNRASANFRMELFRRCLKDCDASLAENASAMPTHLLKVRVLLKLKKPKSAKKQAESARRIALTNPACDAEACAAIGALLRQQRSASAAPSSTTAASASATPPPPPSVPHPAQKQANAAQALLSSSPRKAKAKAKAAAAVAAATAKSNVSQSDVNRGFALVNAGQYAAAIEVFHAIVEDAGADRSVKAAALLGRGSAYAMGSQLREACADFERVVEIHPALLDAWKRLGQVRAALATKEEEGASSSASVGSAGTAAPSSSAPATTATTSGGWFKLALDAFDRATALVEGSSSGGGIDGDLQIARANVLGKMKDHRGAAATLARVLRAEGSQPRAETLYHAGVTASTLGRCEEATSLLEAAVAALVRGASSGGVSASQITIKLAQTRRDFGDATGAMAAFRRAVAASAAERDALTQQRDSAPAAVRPLFAARLAEQMRNETGAMHMEGLLLHGIGLHARAIASCRRALLLDAHDVNAIFLLAICAQAFGDYDGAIVHYDHLLRDAPQHMCFFQREYTFLQRYIVDLPRGGLRPSAVEGGLPEWRPIVRLDQLAHPVLMEGFARRYSQAQGATLATSNASPYTGCALGVSSTAAKSASNESSSTCLAYAHAQVAALGIEQSTIDQTDGTRTEGGGDGSASASATLLLKTLSEAKIGAVFQYDSPGFLTNHRQHRQAALSALGMAQTLDAEWRRASSAGAAAGAQEEAPLLTWREVLEIGVWWRQASEPFDPVWWIDRLTQKTFSEGFGLQTPMLNGHVEIPRYYPYCDRSFKIMKSILLSGRDRVRDVAGALHTVDREGLPPRRLTSAERAAVSAATNVEQLHKAIGGDFWVRACLMLCTSLGGFERIQLLLVLRPPSSSLMCARIPLFFSLSLSGCNAVRSRLRRHGARRSALRHRGHTADAADHGGARWWLLPHDSHSRDAAALEAVRRDARRSVARAGGRGDGGCG